MIIKYEACILKKNIAQIEVVLYDIEGALCLLCSRG